MNRKLSLILSIVTVIFSGSVFSASDDELVSAVSAKDCSKVAALLADGVSPNSLFEDVVLKIKMPVIYIGPINDGGCIKKLLVENGADLNYQVFYKYKDYEGFYITPLSSAVMYGMVDDIELLLKLGANIEEADKYGNNLVEQSLFRYKGGAARNKKRSIIKLLQSYGYKKN